MTPHALRITAAALLLCSASPAAALDLCGDVNDSGNISASDALLVLQRGVEIDVPFTCDPPGVPPQTGQASVFGEGSDGALRQGSVRNFVDNLNGTITDFSTGLMWEKKNDLGDVHDKDNTYTWSPISGNLDGSIVSAFLFLLNSGDGFAGHTDWRLPNRFELESLLSLGTSGPATHFDFNRNCAPACTLTQCNCTKAGSYWSSTTVASLPASAWAVDFNAGSVGSAPKSTALLVRAVRTASEIPTAPTCQSPNPPQCSFGDPCQSGFCSLTRAPCSLQGDCPASPDEQCCCPGGNCI